MRESLFGKIKKGDTFYINWDGKGAKRKVHIVEVFNEGRVIVWKKWNPGGHWFYQLSQRFEFERLLQVPKKEKK